MIMGGGGGGCLSALKSFLYLFNNISNVYSDGFFLFIKICSVGVHLLVQIKFVLWMSIRMESQILV